MSKIAFACLALALLSSAAEAADRKGIRFWNLTSATVTRLQLSPAGKADWGPDQCRNDGDGTVDHDERLRLTGIAAGRYDVRLGYKDGRTCTVRNIDVKEGSVFSVQDKDLTDCTP
ncbi:MAG: hypothetical protein JO010_00020 [Alphaproteobacteria bacterium]|nr:hypothetical protein [Alphaproteobacteria bacterium]MBV9948963.1 hypothetical protein [Myxococcales bacterium]